MIARRRALRWPGRARSLVQLAILAVLVCVIGSQPAHALVFFNPAPSFPNSVTVGQTFPGAIGFANFSGPPESTYFPDFSISEINFVPSCSRPSHDCVSGIETGVFTLGATGQGVTGPPTCLGTWAIAEISSGVFRFTPPGGEGSVRVASGDACVVNFVVTAERVPTVDTSPSTPGSQTTQLLSATARSGEFELPRSSGVSRTTVSPGPVTRPKTEIGVFRPSTGVWYFEAGVASAWGTTGDIEVPGDYDGNGTTDLAVYRPSTGTWFVQGGVTTTWGTEGDIPVPGDYNGDGTTDRAVYRPSMGTWYTQDGPTVAWGTEGDVPVPGDYDGNGTTDLAVYRPSTGTWLVRDGLSSNWGTSGDVPVPADYNGDGTTDIAVYRPSAGTWFVQGGITSEWGAEGDIPVPGDYDGNGTTELAVYRPSAGAWFVQGGPALSWGTPGDRPLPLPHAIRQVFFSVVR